MKTKRIAALALAAALLLSCPGFTALASDGDFVIENGTLVSYHGPGGAVTIPAGVTAIGDEAFEYTEITSVNFPNSLTTIGWGAFMYCSGLTSVSIPNSVTSIGESAFEGCDNLQSVKLPVGLTVISKSLFFDCVKLTSVNIPSNVTEIGMCAFAHCFNLKSVALPEGLSFVGDDAFCETAIPEPIYILEGSVLCFVPASYTEFVIPETVNQVGGGAFDSCWGLKSVIIPDSVTSIGNFAFYGCVHLSSVHLPDSVVFIGYYAFYGCRSLSSINIPSGNIEIGMTAFSKTNINEPIISNDNSVLYYIPDSYHTFTVPDGIKKINGGAFDGCSELTSVTIPESVTSIGEYAFTDCVSLTSVKIPQGVTLINEGLFSYCINLKSITLPEGITSIGSFSFYQCIRLSSVSIPESVVSIGDLAFTECASLTAITIPENVASVGDSAFQDTGITSLYVTGSKTEFNQYAFDNCGVTIYAPEGSTAQVYARENGITFVATIASAVPNASAVYVNGKLISVEAYTIGGYNYFKLRDIAMALRGTEKQFEVGWNLENDAIGLRSNASYTPVGGELAVSGSEASITANLSAAKVYLDGAEVKLTAYIISGYNYFKLRDLGSALNFAVTWDGASYAVRIDTSAGYTG
ncbi:hypothetical protein SDC9_74638 [bioreactor metagenome]|uniref:Copper amine oxidase-like N-terminal domain-containing protein n=1 Tax=bioreactor metagenome TaxID=1076179 RepID=A0A644YIG4_9ZZZZ